MEAVHVVRAWGLILQGYQPNLSIEITRECPLRCPGCYAYGDTHLGGDVVLRQLADYKGQELIDGMLAIVRRYRPIHLSIVGGEPLVRFRELDVLLPKLTAMGIHTQVVTSAVRPIPESWASLPKLQVCVSIDGLAPEHDVRRAPATYERILKHIKGQHVTVHCTVTRQQTRPGYLTEFTNFWAALPDVRRIWFSLYTPQKGEDSP
jgi:MoaA/NifB/PqqE/SkfB family radical SAM enzyme